MPPADVLGELRGMVAQAAAKIRAMSDGQLVTRFLELGGGATVLESEPAPVPRPRKPRAPKPSKPEAKPAPIAPTAPKVSALGAREAILKGFVGRDFMGPTAVAGELGMHRMTVGRAFQSLVAEGLAEHNDKPGRFKAYRLCRGRQAGTKPKAPKPPASDDEEPARVEKPPRPPAFVAELELDVDGDEDLEEEEAEIPAAPDSEPSTIDASGRVLGPARPTYRQSLAAGTGLDEDDPHLARLLRLEACDGDEESNDEGEDVEVDDGEERRPAKLRIAPAPIVDAPRLACVGADESNVLRRRVVAEIGSRQPVTWGEVARALQLDNHARANILPALLKRRVVFARGLGLGAVLALREDLLEEVSGVHRLPAFEVGAGERREDCQGYDGCLDRFTKLKLRRKHLKNRGLDILPRVHQGEESNAEVPGQCPKACSFYAPIPNHVRHGLATGGGSHPLANPR